MHGFVTHISGRLVRTFGILSIMLVLLAGGCTKQPNSKLTAEEVAEIGKLPTVLIITQYSAEIGFVNFKANVPAVVKLIQALKAAQKDGRLSSPEATFQAFWQEYFGHFDRYITPGNVTSRRMAEATLTGSGFFVTPDGYLVTNAHVVASDSQEELNVMLARQGLNDIIQESLETVIKDANEAWDQQPTQEMLEMAAESIAGAYAQTLTVGKLIQKVVAAMGATAPGADAIQKGYPCEIKKVGVPSPGKDVAILKVNQINLPTLPIADDSGIRVGESTYVVGYPGVATFHPFVSQSESVIEADMKEGRISAKRAMPGGWSALETSAPITHGNSGGPALNASGEVVGLATFGSINDSGQEVQGFNFLVPASVISEYLREANVIPVEGELSHLYRDGVILFESQKYRSALNRFRAADELRPGYPYIQKMISDCHANITKGFDRSYVPFYWGGGGVLILILFAVWWFLKQGKTAVPAAASSEADEQ
jgi:serine protease Do